MDYEIIIGLEIHAQLSTRTKMFCGCSLSFGEEPNTYTCPVCLGHPGILPVTNKKAVEYGLKVALAFNCEIADFTIFHRKNYFYPDLPKGYQISQYDLPIGKNGFIELTQDDKIKRIGITRVHLEEDAAKLLHPGVTGRISESEYSLVDFNRGGTPLVEIVSEPDLRSPEEARSFMQELKSILEHLGVSDCDMEKGSMRCDANVSVQRTGAKEMGVKTEIKNMNSFYALEKGLAYEAERQIKLIESGEKIIQETRHWDSAQNLTLALRSKEEAHDYRYFPEPDLVPIIFEKKWVEELRKTLAELPATRRDRFQKVYGLSSYDARVLTSLKALGDFFEQCLKLYDKPKMVCNWLTVELSALLKEKNANIADSPIKPEDLAGLLKLINDGTISGKIAKDVFREMFFSGKKAEAIVKEKGLIQITDEDKIEAVVREVINKNKDAVQDYQEGKERAFGFLVGQVMKETKGKANPKLVNELLKKLLGSGE